MKQLWTPWRMKYLLGEEEQGDGCIFCEKPRCDDAQEHILYRGRTCFIILNRYPYNSGHLMVVPYQHTPSLEYLDDETSLEMMQLVRCSLRILRDVYHPQGFNIGVNEGSAGGAGVSAHVHLHIVPRWDSDANYMSVVGETRVMPELLDDSYVRLRSRFDALM